ncbi:phytanoyl-CoA dioxygenase family protein [Streptomyces californicus]|uniref:phytanoyl-CoA dioxygenase family protein n=1 Tax=Streptomyces californicus TaxID=67351 RepID=UPI0036F4DA6E
MMLTPQEITTYERDGLLVLPGLFRPAEVETLRTAFERDALLSGDHRVTESDGRRVRAVYGSHLRQPAYAALIRTPRLLGAARSLLGSEVTLYQLKVNAKPALGGEGWSWHQDYSAWRIADRLPAPLLVNAALFLDPVDATNGPLTFVPGSHRHVLEPADPRGTRRSEQHVDPDDIALSPEQTRALVDLHGVTAPTGPAGTVILFHPRTVHGSGVNTSPLPRRLVLITYNHVHNAPRPAGVPRPAHLVSHDAGALRLLDPDELPGATATDPRR